MSIDLLRAKLATKQNWIRTKYECYEQKRQPLDPSPVVPAKEKNSYNTTLGWCTQAVDDLANRLIVDSLENDNFGMWDIFQQNNKDILFDSAIKSALISACSFVYVVESEDGVKLQLIDGRNATGVIDPSTFLLKEGYAILDTDEYGTPILEAYFTPFETVFFSKSTHSEIHIANKTGYPLLVPIIYRPDADRRPFGQSRISKAMMDIQDKARYTVTCMEVAREFGAFPQKYIVGLSQDAEFDTLKNAYKTFLAIDKDGDGDKPVVGQFTQISLSSYLAQLQEYRTEFDKAAGLDAKEHLEIIATGAQRTFGAGLLNVGLVSASLRDGAHYNRSVLHETQVIWKPVYAMDTQSISTFGDGIIKINQAVPNALSAKSIRLLTGLPIEENATSVNPNAEQEAPEMEDNSPDEIEQMLDDFLAEIEAM